MTFSFSLARSGQLGRTEALACLTANLGLPGSGSLMAGRRVGYFQLGVALAGVGLTTFFGVMFLVWAFLNMEQLRAPEADPFVSLVEIWRHVKWSVIGMVGFAVAWVWSLATSFSIVRSTRAERQVLP